MQTDSPLQRVAQYVLIVGNRHPDADTGSLTDIRTLPRQVCNFRNDLFHEPWNMHLVPVAGEGEPLPFHDVDLMIRGAGIVRANLRATAVLQRGDDAATVGVVFRV